jgi:hypothetical protein
MHRSAAVPKRRTDRERTEDANVEAGRRLSQRGVRVQCGARKVDGDDLRLRATRLSGCAIAFSATPRRERSGGRTDGRCDLLQFCRVARDKDDVEARTRELNRKLAADAVGRAGDDCRGVFSARQTCVDAGGSPAHAPFFAPNVESCRT